MDTSIATVPSSTVVSAGAGAVVPSGSSEEADRVPPTTSIAETPSVMTATLRESDDGTWIITSMDGKALHHISHASEPGTGTEEETVFYAIEPESVEEKGQEVCNPDVLVAALENLKEDFQQAMIKGCDEKSDSKESDVVKKAVVNKKPPQLEVGEIPFGQKGVLKLQPEEDEEDDDDEEEEIVVKPPEIQKSERSGRTIKRPAHFCDMELEDWTPSKDTGRKRYRRRNKEVSASNKQYACDLCSEAFVKESTLDHHYDDVHTGPYKCEGCEKEFPKKAQLKTHEKIHLGDRPFKCDKCEKAFPYSSHLTVHRRIHTGEKPYQCEYCGKGFVASCDLKRHIRSHIGLKPHDCTLCERSFAAMSDLRRHMKTHTGKKSHECNNCGKMFARADSLRLHKQLIHQEIHEAYQCDECEKIFMQMRYLRAHQKYLHEEDGPYTIMPKSAADNILAQQKAKRDAESSSKTDKQNEEKSDGEYTYTLPPTSNNTTASVGGDTPTTATVTTAETSTTVTATATEGTSENSQESQASTKAVKNIIVFLKQDSGTVQCENGEVISQTVQQIELPLDGLDGDISGEALQEVALQAMQQISSGENIEQIVIHQVTNP
uniref:Zinc finger and SCAN domain-containing protein 12-like n=1 Tax=Saccoglossus kowalevskii TaxID=10224 RepID=A0ABM0MJC1_SACKO|nr:PREDICTED: zinc finger and SCAN domain-containing protein 12-like [Saccoglossus kowalevskii]